MTNEEFIQFEKMVRTNHVYQITDDGTEEVFRVELFDNGKFGTWVRTYARNCQASLPLKDLKQSNFRVLAPIILT